MQTSNTHIEIRNGVISFYGNKVGYAEESVAIVDTLFATAELAGWLAERKLEVEWRDGVYDRLHSAQAAPELKRVRIWQLKPDSDALKKFVSYAETLENFGEPNREDYEISYDGQPGTNDHEQLFELFNLTPPGEGHSLSMSDVVEFYSGDSSEFFYVDRLGFKNITFGDKNQEKIRSAEQKRG